MTSQESPKLKSNNTKLLNEKIQNFSRKQSLSCKKKTIYNILI